MDLTLFIVLLLIFIIFVYGISMMNDLKKEVRTITGNKNEDNYLKTSIDKFKDVLEYLKEFL